MIDDDDIPNPEAEAQARRVRRIGVGLWGLVIGSIIVLMSSDTGELTPIQALILAGIAIGTAIFAILLGWLVAKFLEFFGVFGRLVYGIIFTLLLLVMLPPAVTLLLENIDIPAGAGGPLADLLGAVFR